MLKNEAATVAKLAGALYDALETSKRDNGETFVRLRDGAPEWMEEAVTEAHGQDIFPDDWRYEEIASAAGAIHDNDGNWETVADEVEPDVYNIDRLRWLASHLDRPAICDEAARDLGFEYDGGDNDLLALVGLGQMHEREGIIRRLGEFLDALDVDEVSA